MAGYTAMARIQGGHVRMLAWDVRGAVERAAPEASAGDEAAGCEDRTTPALRERWAAVREELGMMTFFLLDPESWR